MAVRACVFVIFFLLKCRYSRLRQSFSEMSLQQDAPIHVSYKKKEIKGVCGRAQGCGVELCRALLTAQFGSYCMHVT